MKKNAGTLEVICGPMFSGKTEELIRRVKRAVIGKKKVQVFKHNFDKRYGTKKKIFSHNGLSFRTEIVANSNEIIKKVKSKTQIVAIDEAQWFGKDLVAVIEKLLKIGKMVIVSGLSTTYDKQPFEPIPTLMSLADKVIKLSAVCIICGNEAIFHKRLAIKKNVDAKLASLSLVGKMDAYQARCRNCFEL